MKGVTSRAPFDVVLIYKCQEIPEKFCNSKQISGFFDHEELGGMT